MWLYVNGELKFKHFPQNLVMVGIRLRVDDDSFHRKLLSMILSLLGEEGLGQPAESNRVCKAQSRPSDQRDFGSWLALSLFAHNEVSWSNNTQWLPLESTKYLAATRLCSVCCVHTFASLAKAVRLLTVSLHCQPIGLKMCSVDTLVDLHPVG